MFQMYNIQIALLTKVNETKQNFTKNIATLTDFTFLHKYFRIKNAINDTESKFPNTNEPKTKSNKAKVKSSETKVNSNETKVKFDEKKQPFVHNSSTYDNKTSQRKLNALNEDNFKYHTCL